MEEQVQVFQAELAAVVALEVQVVAVLALEELQSGY